MANYIPHTDKDIRYMLDKLNLEKLSDLYNHIPKDLLVEKLNLKNGISQLELERYLTKMSKENIVFDTILRGAGAYNHYIPPVVNHLSSRAEFVTAYTPYQAEMSQGVLQSIFEYQTMIANLTGMDMSNASLYDGATAAAEAIVMTLSKKKNKVIISKNINPETKAVLYSHLSALDVEILEIGDTYKTEIPNLSEVNFKEVASFYIENPNFYGVIEDVKLFGEFCVENKINYIMGVNPISLAILESPKDCNADIVVGEGQSLGMPLSFGGPYLGFLACKDKLKRKIPGRVVGETVDAEGNRAYVLTMQAREQHIRRDKALSNICSNQALCALRAGIYLSANGYKGLKDVAVQCTSKAHYAKQKLLETGLFNDVCNDEFYFEFILESKIDVEIIEKELAKNNILSGLTVDNNKILWCFTEMVEKSAIDKTVEILEGLK